VSFLKFYNFNCVNEARFLFSCGFDVSTLASILSFELRPLTIPGSLAFFHLDFFVSVR